MRLIPYIRVSTDDQAETGHSLAAQEHGLQRFAAHNGHQLAEQVADEGVSAGKALGKRRGGAALLATLRAGNADGVLVARMDRLFRNLFDALGFFAEAADAGWVVISAGEHIDTSTPGGRLQLHIMLATAEYERQLASVRTAAVSTSLRERGKVFGTTPYGCLAVDGDLLRLRDIWAIREMIVEWHRGHRYSLRTIRGMLHDQRIPAPAGGRWWSTSTLAGLLDSHDTLAHLPMHSTDADGTFLLTNAPSVSRGTKIEHNSAH